MSDDNGDKITWTPEDDRHAKLKQEFDEFRRDTIKLMYAVDDLIEAYKNEESLKGPMVELSMEIALWRNRYQAL